MSLLWKTASDTHQKRPLPGVDDHRFSHIPIPDNPCGCEHEEHWSPSEAMHPYLRTPAGEHHAFYVGAICDDCAHGHYAQSVALVPDHCSECG